MIFATRSNGLDTLLSALSVTQLGTCAGKLKEREVNLSVPNVKLCERFVFGAYTSRGFALVGLDAVGLKSFLLVDLLR